MIIYPWFLVEPHSLNPSQTDKHAKGRNTGDDDNGHLPDDDDGHPSLVWSEIFPPTFALIGYLIMSFITFINTYVGINCIPFFGEDDLSIPLFTYLQHLIFLIFLKPTLNV